MILFHPKSKRPRHLLLWRKSAISRLYPSDARCMDGAFSGDLRSRIKIRGSAWEPVKQSLQPFLLRLHQPPRRICLKNPIAPVRLSEQRICTFGA
jgi:hypothetical protein